MVPSGAKSELGVKVSVDPLARQDPAVVGLTVGKGELLDNGEDKVTLIGVLGETPLDPPEGAIDRTLSGAGATVVPTLDPAG